MTECQLYDRLVRVHVHDLFGFVGRCGEALSFRDEQVCVELCRVPQPATAVRYSLSPDLRLPVKKQCKQPEACNLYSADTWRGADGSGYTSLVCRYLGAAELPQHRVHVYSPFWFSFNNSKTEKCMTKQLTEICHSRINMANLTKLFLGPVKYILKVMWTNLEIPITANLKRSQRLICQKIIPSFHH